MSLIKWSPMLDPFNEMDRWFDSSNFAPAVDIFEDENNLYAETPLPGVDVEKVNISIENDILTIEGSSEQTSEVDDKNYYRREVRHGSFHRSVALPSSVKSDQASAKYKDGILKITIPKEERVKPKQIKIDIKK